MRENSTICKGCIKEKLRESSFYRKNKCCRNITDFNRVTKRLTAIGYDVEAEFQLVKLTSKDYQRPEKHLTISCALNTVRTNFS